MTAIIWSATDSCLYADRRIITSDGNSQNQIKIRHLIYKGKRYIAAGCGHNSYIADLYNAIESGVTPKYPRHTYEFKATILAATIDSDGPTLLEFQDSINPMQLSPQINYAIGCSVPGIRAMLDFGCNISTIFNLLSKYDYRISSEFDSFCVDELGDLHE